MCKTFRIKSKTKEIYKVCYVEFHHQIKFHKNVSVIVRAKNLHRKRGPSINEINQNFTNGY